jgi:hypothetical protein
MEIDESKRVHEHRQMTKATFHSESLAPITTTNPNTKVKTIGKPRFSVEPLIYITGVGWEQVDPMASGNEFMIAFYNYVRMKEFMGYEHTGLSSAEIKITLENLWGEKIE